ncbi:fructosamine kinase family protein [Reichenbachiella versicolor]|uniref:fructosamine kinase family protein n=1 Tax=Reichenbachiella versicolor TaxID=1821036 RepID=UPI000D6EA2BF|nr:fructosamine kinase family protein [Reichenbachiella versicolor]
MNLLQEVIRHIFGDESSDNVRLNSIGGGCINNTGWFEWKGERFFLKWNHNAKDLFEKEELGLKLLKEVNSLAVPEVLGRGKSIESDFLCLSYIPKGIETKRYWELLGHGLANLHQNTNESFGLFFDNHIGRLPQSNKPKSSWIEFFITRRLTPQIKIAERYLDKTTQKKFEILFNKLQNYFPDEPPALLHGDLWSGNIMSGKESSPYIFDPAVFFGHREAELAFTTLFGGFDKTFYASYQESFPLRPQFQERIDIYNLYPLLVHVNLFGSSYLMEVNRILQNFV